MAANTGKKNTEKKINVMSLHKRVKVLEGIIFELLEASKKVPGDTVQLREPGINKIETFNGDKTPDKKTGMDMDEEHRDQSMVNAIKVLPPNFIKDGRHSKENIQAICGFNVTPEMLDSLYSRYEHTAEGVKPLT